MLYFKHDEIPDYNFQQAVKKPIPIRCTQLHEPFQIETMEGLMQGKAGDYLIIGTKGEMYPCDKTIFEETYDIL
ncbi:MAG TPA: hypothetical protein VGE06_11190 [Flavisolibacter sp.]